MHRRESLERSAEVELALNKLPADAVAEGRVGETARRVDGQQCGSPRYDRGRARAAG